MRWFFLFLIFMSFGLLLHADEAMGSLRVPKQLEDTDIEDKIGAKLPLDTKLINHENREITLKEYFPPGEKRPMILAFVYYKCPMLCGLISAELQNTLMDLDLEPGVEYRVVSVSIDPDEDASLAHAKQQTYLEAMKPKTKSDFWQFHVAEAKESARLAEAVGFRYRKDPQTGEYAHGAGIFVITPDGVLASTVYGLNFKASDLKMALLKAADGNIGTLFDRVLMSCFHYKADSHRYGIYIMGVMRLGGVLTILFVAMYLLWNISQERRRKKALTQLPG